MKHLRQLLGVALLLLALSISTSAGDIQMPGITDPPPPPRASVLVPGGMGTGANDTTSGNIDIFTETALNLLIGAISIF